MMTEEEYDFSDGFLVPTRITQSDEWRDSIRQLVDQVTGRIRLRMELEKETK